MFNHYYCQVSLSSFLLIFPLKTWETIGQQPLYNHLPSTAWQLPRCPAALAVFFFLSIVCNLSSSRFKYITTSSYYLGYFLLNFFHLFRITHKWLCSKFFYCELFYVRFCGAGENHKFRGSGFLWCLGVQFERYTFNYSLNKY